MSGVRLGLLAFALGTALTLPGPRDGLAANRDTLWSIVHGRCVPEQQQAGDPKPCALVQVSDGVERGYAVLKDLNGMAQFLLIPSARVHGIDDPAVLAPGTVNYFDAAWTARTYVEGVLGHPLPRTAVSLAVNAVPALSQDQLHIHIDCLRAEVGDALRDRAAEIGPGWAPFPVPLAGRTYLAMRVAGEQLGPHDPFKLLADGVAGAREAMGMHTLIVVGADTGGQPGFVLLARRIAPDTGETGHGTELQDRSCGTRPAQPPKPAD